MKKLGTHKSPTDPLLFLEHILRSTLAVSLMQAHFHFLSRSRFVLSLLRFDPPLNSVLATCVSFDLLCGLYFIHKNEMIMLYAMCHGFSLTLSCHLLAELIFISLASSADTFAALHFRTFHLRSSPDPWDLAKTQAQAQKPLKHHHQAQH